MAIKRTTLSDSYINIKKLNPKATIPTRGSEYSAGYDLYACVDKEIIIPAHDTVIIETGIAMAIPVGCFGGIYARSGLAAKQGLRPANCVGVVDSDYRGEVKVALHNDSDVMRVIRPNERIAQIIIQSYLNCDLFEVDNLDETDRGEGGFGSTGK